MQIQTLLLINIFNISKDSWDSFHFTVNFLLFFFFIFYINNLLLYALGKCISMDTYQNI